FPICPICPICPTPSHCKQRPSETLSHKLNPSSHRQSSIKSSTSFKQPRSQSPSSICKSRQKPIKSSILRPPQLPMQQAVVTRTCRPCGRQFTVQTGTFELQGKNPGQQQQQQQQQQESQSEESRTRGQLKPLRLTLADWNVFPETTVLAPQQAEGVVCNWLQTTAAQMKLLDDESRLYGKVIFDPLGELYDFEISTLSPKMLSPGFGNWMSTLASGEVLLDIVNCLIDHCLPAAVGRNEAGNIFEIITAEPLKKVRLLDVAPNQLAACMFLGNHNRLIDDFLDPLLASVRDIGLPPPGEKPGTAGTSGRPCTSFAPWDTTCCGAATRLRSGPGRR
ncbi:hypothetical protein BOX15_Mlig009799g5, partial [Macrostomum lignano]